MQLIRQRLTHLKPSCHQRNPVKSIIKNNRFLTYIRLPRGLYTEKKNQSLLYKWGKKFNQIENCVKIKAMRFFNERGPWHIKIWKHVQLYLTMGNTIKTILNYHFTPIRLTKLQTFCLFQGLLWDVVPWERSHRAGRNVNWEITL